ncbi:phenylacetate--CoA ligase family protein [Microbacterium sp.]|uniref:phenylacetate--CoA ligase family protein n=1 Tax=Microbacterium sp. TaxID=51671 RepID=UPI003C794415
MRRLIFKAKTSIGARSSLALAAELERNERLAPASLAALTAERSIAHARYAMQNSPFYRDLYSAQGITLSDLADPAAFTELPLVDKQMVRDHFDSIRTPQATDRTSAESLSGGTTGEPLRILRDLRVPIRAVEWRLFRWWGVNPWDHRADLYRQQLVGAAKRRHDLQWWPSKRLHLDARAMSDEAIRDFVTEWNDAEPTIIVGYVGGVLELCRSLRRLGLTLVPPIAVALTAAALPEGVRREIEETLRAPAYDHYRSSEIPWMAGECRAHSGLHVFSDLRRLEVLDAAGRSAPAGSSGEVVVTDMTNRVFPLIRYRLGDRTRLLTGPCECGVTLPRIAPIDGRTADALHLPDGGVIAGESLTGLFSPTPTAVRQFQLVQSADHSVMLRCILGSSAHAEEEIRAAVDLLRGLGHGQIEVGYELVDSIPHVAGKTRFIISDAPSH